MAPLAETTALYEAIAAGAVAATPRSRSRVPPGCARGASGGPLPVRRSRRELDRPARRRSVPAGSSWSRASRGWARPASWRRPSRGRGPPALVAALLRQRRRRALRAARRPAAAGGCRSGAPSGVGGARRSPVAPRRPGWCPSCSRTRGGRPDVPKVREPRPGSSTASPGLWRPPGAASRASWSRRRPVGRRRHPAGARPPRAPGRRRRPLPGRHHPQRRGRRRRAPSPRPRRPAPRRRRRSRSGSAARRAGRRRAGRRRRAQAVPR